jgi:hypothetical protein
MTIEKSCFIHPEDIEAVQFKCTHCGGATTIPIKQLINGDLRIFLMQPCRHCRTESGFAINSSELEHLLTLTTILGGLPALFKGRNLQFSFQVKCPE